MIYLNHTAPLRYARPNEGLQLQVCASAPALRPLVVHYFPLLLGGSARGSGRKKSNETDPESIRLHRAQGEHDDSDSV